jgi:TPP-dependent pyruvate/acetoin dehydrogenase alpha subunit
LGLLADWLTGENGVEQSIIDQLESSVTTDVQAAVDFALNAPYPSSDEVTNHVFA